MKIIEAKIEHWNEIKRIYIAGIETKNATFQSACDIGDAEGWFNGKIKGSTFVLREENNVLGFIALYPISDRCVYAGVTEVSVYVDPATQGKGVGSRLLEHIINFAEQNNIWTIQAGIFPENIASIKLHEKLGFRIVGRREKIGKMDGVWRDTLLLERRSKTIV